VQVKRGLFEILGINAHYLLPITKKRDCFVPRNASRLLVRFKIDVHPPQLLIDLAVLFEL